MRTMIRVLCSLGLLVATKTFAISPPAGTPDVVISHLNGTISRIGTIFKEEGDTVLVRVIDANRRCYSYNGSLRKVEEQKSDLGGRKLPVFDEFVDFQFEYTEPSILTIEARLIGTRVPGCRPELERTVQSSLKPWEIRFETRGWDLAFSGGFTVDTLSNPEFGLVGGKFTKPGETTPTDGFFIRRFPENESDNRLDTAAMVTLYHNDPHLFRRLRLNWAPFTFGIGAGENSALRFYFGTGIRAANKLFLNVGLVGGPVQRLKNGMSITKDDPSSFTTDPNALNGLPTRTAFGAYIGVSYSFVGVGPDAFRGRFQPQKPAPTDVVDEAGDDTIPDSKATPSVAFTPPEVDSADPKIYTYDVTVSNPKSGTKIENATFKHTPHAGAASTTWTCKMIKGAIESACDPKTGSGAIERKDFTLDPNVTLQFIVTSKFGAANPAQKELTATLEATSIQKVEAKEMLPSTEE